jgi:hypothetical protein
MTEIETLSPDIVPDFDVLEWKREVLGTQAGNRTQSQKMDVARDRGVATITAELFFAMIG